MNKLNIKKSSVIIVLLNISFIIIGIYFIIKSSEWGLYFLNLYSEHIGLDPKESLEILRGNINMYLSIGSIFLSIGLYQFSKVCIDIINNYVSGE